MTVCLEYQWVDINLQYLYQDEIHFKFLSNRDYNKRYATAELAAKCDLLNYWIKIVGYWAEPAASLELLYFL